MERYNELELKKRAKQLESCLKTLEYKWRFGELDDNGLSKLKEKYNANRKELRQIKNCR